eukprot:tig00020876_g14839.t1
MERECGSPHAGDDRTERLAQDDEGGGAAERDMEGNSTAGALAAQSVIDLDSADETMESRKTTSEAPALSGDAEGDGAPVIDLDSAEGAKDTGGTARAAATANNPRKATVRLRARRLKATSQAWTGAHVHPAAAIVDQPE